MYKASMPDDHEFSHAVKKAGFLVAWPDKPITKAIGFLREELKRDPDYYIKNYRQKLASLRVRSIVQDMLRLHIDPILKEWMARLFMLYWTKFRKRYLP
jgi:hypothetical protein